MQEVVIIGAVRTAIGKFGGSLSGISVPELGAVVAIANMSFRLSLAGLGRRIVPAANC